MCLIDGGEMYAVYHQRWVMNARHEHRCGECERIIQSGEQYRCTSGLMDGTWYTNHVCHHCTFATRWLFENCHGYVDRGVREDLQYHLEDEAWNWPPATRFAMARVLVGMRRRWEQRDGSMMPLPREIPDLEHAEAA